LERKQVSFADLKTMIGAELGVSDWIEIDQSMIDTFATTTRDRQWIHVDVERAQRESPYHAPIAHGYLTLSLIPALAAELQIKPAGVAVTINYGLDKLRFLSPVKAGSRVRLRSKLISLEDKAPGQHLMKTLSTMEIDGEAKPAFVAETLMLHVEAA
jgi:acyl dehydratase